LIVIRGKSKVPLDSLGTKKPCVTTVNKMTTMLINARVLAFASYFPSAHVGETPSTTSLTLAISRYKLRIADAQYKITITARLLVKRLNTGISPNPGNTAAKTCGMESPTMMPNATMPPNAKCPLGNGDSN